MSTKPNRKTFAFPKPENFFSQVHDRLHMVVERFVFADRKDARFTLIVNAIPRDKPEEIDWSKPVPLKYVSIPQQRQLLEGKNKLKELDEAWKALDQKPLQSTNAEEGKSLWQQVISNTYSFESVFDRSRAKKTLADYFAGPEDQLNDSQIWEKKILGRHFSISNDNGNISDCFIAIPLIQFGEIDGFVYLIYEDKDHHYFDENNVMDLVIGFSGEYQEVILAWDLVEEDYDRSYASRRIIKLICKQNNHTYFDNKNPIIRDLNFPEYYRNHKKYYKDRFKQHDRMLSLHYEQMIRHGSTTILLDSYAHNISAHALTTMTWIFKKRSKLKLRDEQMAIIEKKMKGLVSDAMRRKYSRDEDDEMSNYADLIDFGGSLTREIFPFLKFLQEKGGFWSGLTRDINSGGQVSTMYSILWYDFVYNALYLGTIAESEQIRRLHIDITIYDDLLSDVVHDKDFIRQLPDQKARRFATIDLGKKSVSHDYDPGGKNGDKTEGGDFYIELANKEKIWYEDLQGLENLSRFVQLGDEFMQIRDALKKIKVFFPGSVVGKHAFFTMIENELRNIKHYFGKDAEVPHKRDEMTLHISIQRASLGNNTSTELYQIGLWLGFDTLLADEKRGDQNPFLVKRRFDMLWKDILDENTKQPRLGGNSQDKVCAAMLFNSSFSSVQYGSFRTQALGGNKGQYAKRDAIFYPWITPAVCYTGCKTEFRVPAQAAIFDIKYDRETGGVVYQSQEDAFKEKIEEAFRAYEANCGKAAKGLGVLKKYIYLWRGETIRTEHDNEEMALDHLGRFKFVIAEPGKGDIWENARYNGVIRLIKPFDKILANDIEKTMEAYQQWLTEWFDEPMALTFTDEEGTSMGSFIFDKSKKPALTFYSDFLPAEESGKDIRFKLTDEFNDRIWKLSEKSEGESYVQCAHNKQGLPPEMIRYRSHGIIYQHFMEGKPVTPKLRLTPIPSVQLPELFEFMATRVCIFDNRLFSRADKTRLPFYREKLRLYFSPESRLEIEPDSGEFSTEWGDPVSKSQVRKTHFLILHLSFVDGWLKNYYQNEEDHESNIGMFIEKELEPLVGKPDGSGLRDNFILIVTTGRGRQNWHEFLKRERYIKYRKSVIFRPIESLISAMEDSLMLNDDFDLKYRIVKALFGS